MEKPLVDKAMKDNLEREKGYIARKHELLVQQLDEVSRTGSRSRYRSIIQQVEAWVR